MLGVRALEDDVALSSLGQAPLRCSLISLPYREDEATAHAVVRAILQDDINALERVKPMKNLFRPSPLPHVVAYTSVGSSAVRCSSSHHWHNTVEQYAAPRYAHVDQL